MKRNFFSIVILGIILSSCGGKNDQSQAQRQQMVGVINIPSGDFITSKSYPTSMEGITNSEARPKVSGYITDVLVDEGQRVHKGQLLFRLETTSLNEEASAAQANINAAQVQVDQLTPLVEKGIVSASQLETAKAKLAQAKAAYSAIQANIGYANVVSPVDGYVGQVRIRKGNLVSPADRNPLTTVSDISKIYAYFTMNERDYLDFLKSSEGKTKEEKIKNLPEITLLMANGDEYPYKGKVQTINSQVDKATGTISFRASFDNPDQILTNGSTGTIKIPTQYTNVLYVPRKSTFELQGITYVMVTVKAGDKTTVETRAVDIIDQTADFYLINAVNVQKGEEIVGEGVTTLRDGMEVISRPVPFDSIAKPLPVLFQK
ncbi:MAG: efflux RND transporter periplasmic adaptor subunit [Brumimicrobium sp.]|nr:efflux RND transporter periplasmic adaptor subunit [Brumimicrobium sp.]